MDALYFTVSRVCFVCLALAGLLPAGGAEGSVSIAAPSPPTNLRIVDQSLSTPSPSPTAAATPPTHLYGVYRGAYPDGPVNVNAHEAWMGRTVQVAVAFAAGTWDDIAGNTSLTRGWQTWKAANLGRRLSFGIGMLPKQANGETLAMAATGSYDHYFTDLATNLVSRGMGDSIIRLGEEFNGRWFPWTAQGHASEFKGAWIHYVNAMRAVPGAKFTFCFNPSQGRNNDFDATTAYPGDAYVDEIGLDFYDVSFATGTYPYPTGATSAQRLACQQTAWSNNLTKVEGLEFWHSFAVTHGKPFSFPEWGCSGRSDGHGGLDNPYYIGKMQNWILNHSRVSWYAYFDTNGSDGILHKVSPTPTFPNASATYHESFGSN